MVTTDQSDYAPGDIVSISGSGFDANDSITLLVVHADETPTGGAGHEPFSAVSDESGNFSSSWYVEEDDSAGSTFLLTADGASGLHAETTFTDTVPGHGVVTSVTADDGGCVAVSASGVSTDWEVEPGAIYTITIEGVDDAANGGTDATIPFFIQGGVSGNLCLTGQQTGPGAYSLQLTIPLNACASSTINYGSCDVLLAKRAKGNNADADPATATNGVHYRANTDCTPGGAVSCSATGACCVDTACEFRTISNCASHSGIYQGTGVPCSDTTCKPPGCEVDCPADITVDCNGSTDPADTGSAVCSDDCTASYTDSVLGGTCPQESTITRTWTCTSPSGETKSCDQIITVLDTTPPVVHCPADCEIECGATDCSVSPCSTEGCQCGGEATCTDDCGDCSISSSCEFVPDGCESTVAGVTPPPKVGKIITLYSSGDGAAAVATASCPNTATCTQTIRIVDTIAPELTCSSDITVQNDPGQCCTNVSFTAHASDSCDDTPTVECSNASGSCFGVGTTHVSCIATDDCTNEDGCSFSVTVKTSICGRKTYDANVDGNPTGDAGIPGWKVVLSGAASRTVYTDADGRYCFNGLNPGNYTVREVIPCSNWVNTTPTSCVFPNLTCPETCEFNNVCLGGGGGHTIGYWSCKNGQTIINDGGSSASELALLTSLNLRTSSGANFNPTSVSSFQSWLNGASSTNMAYMLSAQLAATELSVEHGDVSGSAIVQVIGCGGFLSVNDLMNAANTALGADGYTPSGDPNRANQQCLKNALDRLNNNRSFVQRTACYISHY